MAIPQNTLIGRTRRSIGNVEFSSWKGINVMKSKPITVANPRTDLQVLQRSKLSQIVAIARMVSGAYQLGYVQQAVKQSTYNAFVSYNVRNAFGFGELDNISFNESKLKVARGTIQANTEILGVVDKVAGTIKLVWNKDRLATGQSANDQICVAVKIRFYNGYVVFNRMALRSEGEVLLVFPDFKLGDSEFDTYSFFVSEDGKKSSDSVYWTNVI